MEHVTTETLASVLWIRCKCTKWLNGCDLEFIYELHILRTAQPHNRAHKQPDENQPVTERKIKMPVTNAMAEQL